MSVAVLVLQSVSQARSHIIEQLKEEMMERIEDSAEMPPALKDTARQLVEQLLAE